MKLKKKVYLTTIINALLIFLLPCSEAVGLDLYCQFQRSVFLGQENQAKLLFDQVELEQLDPCTIELDGKTVHLPKGTTILHLVATSPHEFSQTFIAKIIAKGAYIDAPNEHGNTPLLLAAALARYNLVRSFLNLGADVHSINSLGQNALFLAVMSNEIIDWGARSHVASFLLFNRVKSIHNGHSTLFNLLSFLIANPNSLNTDGLSQMFDCLLAAEFIIDGSEILQLLKEQKVLPKKLVYSIKFNILAMSVPATVYLGAGLLTGALMIYWHQ